MLCTSTRHLLWFGLDISRDIPARTFDIPRTASKRHDTMLRVALSLPRIILLRGVSIDITIVRCLVKMAFNTGNIVSHAAACRNNFIEFYLWYSERRNETAARNFASSGMIKKSKTRIVLRDRRERANVGHGAYFAHILTISIMTQFTTMISLFHAVFSIAQQ